MAEEQKGKEGAEGETPAVAPKNNKKLFIIIAAVVVLIAAIGVPVVLMRSAPKKEETPELAADAAHQAEDDLEPEGANDEEELAEGEQPLGAIFPLETFVVNLKGSRYIRLQAQLEFVGRDIPRKFFSRIVPVRDLIISKLANHTQEDLQSETDRDNLKKEIKDAVNEILKKEEVRSVYFTQFLVQ